jgi:hypothetical protein
MRAIMRQSPLGIRAACKQRNVTDIDLIALLVAKTK